MPLCTTRTDGRREIRNLIRRFRAHEAEYSRSDSSYNEAQARSDFIGPLFQALGWDVQNERGQPSDLREVIQEAILTVEDESQSRKPDYEFRLARQKKFYVEAKKPSARIDADKAAAFQTRRYGFSAGLPISILTNFRELAIYDCVPVPDKEDDARIARLEFCNYEEFDDLFDQLYDRFSREAVYSGAFDSTFGIDAIRQGTAQFDEYFLVQVNSWRKRLAKDINSRNPGLSNHLLTYVVQRILCRLIFLRICEDRDLEKYETLASLTEEAASDDLKRLLERADERYNSGLFDLMNDPSIEVTIGNDTLLSIVKELYYPQSPYTFSVVEANVLGDIYEIFLAQQIVVQGDRDIAIVDKPEVKTSGGVFPTPKYIVDSIIERSLAPLIDGKTPSELASLRVADICCGSGPFLLAAFDFLLNYHLDWYMSDGVENHRGQEIYEIARAEWRLSLHEKRRILLNCIYGVDIDDQAVEFARFGLLLRLIEEESKDGIDAYLKRYGEASLPSLDQNIKCGNSLVDSSRFIAFEENPPDELIEKTNLFDWDEEFPDIVTNDGFDVIIGNPPYIRIQNMIAYSPVEVGFYQSAESGYECSQSDNFDKYSLFIERALSLLRTGGRLGYIVPHKFFTIRSGQCLRRLISEGRHLKEIVHFGVQQVFGERSTTYTCILILENAPTDCFQVEQVDELATWRYGKPVSSKLYSANSLSEKAWSFVPDNVKLLFDRLRREHPASLETMAEIFVGVQTSADKIYIVRPLKETKNSVTFVDTDGQEWRIERGIVRPCLLDVTLEPFSKPEPNSLIIFPYELCGGHARLYTPQEMRSKFPRTWSYLKAHRRTLADRSIQGGTPETWYRYGRSQSLTKFDGEKIVLPILSREPRYAYDDRNIIVTGGGNGPYYLIRPKGDADLSVFFLLAILCHPVVEAMVRASSSFFRGGYYSHGKQFVKDIPVPNIDPSCLSHRVAYDKIVALVQKLIDINQKLKSARTSKQRSAFARQRRPLRNKINALVESLYGLSQADLEIAATVQTAS